ncbi:MAG: YhjD/YihY/BrkB family envelope integrity protein, partial [Cyanobacteria bacterium J06648_11]
MDTSNRANVRKMVQWAKVKTWFDRAWLASRQDRWWRRASLGKRLRYRSYWSYRVLRQVIRQATANRLPSAAAEMAFNSVLALFPMLLFLVTVVGRLVDRSSLAGAATRLSEAIFALESAVPPRVLRLLFDAEWISMARQQSQQSIWLQAIAALWIASACLIPAIRAIDNSYGIPRHRRRAWWLNRLIAAVVVIGTASATTIALILLVVVQPILAWGAD